MNWTHGYFASEGGYTYGTYSETLPGRLWFAALMHGHIGLRTKFRYLDLGCGQGLNLIIAAASHPESEFIGIDFMPEHIAHGRALADLAGLKNVTFIEADFLELANETQSLGDSFDYAVAHGISAWVSDEVGQAIYQIVSKSLKPGGIFYDSYNTLPGWISTMPFQHIVASNQRHMDGRTALAGALALFKSLKECGAVINAALPSLSQRIDMIDRQDLSYVLQEYNNQHWRPKWVSKVFSDLASYKLSFLGSATLTEAFDQNYPEAMRSLFTSRISPSEREQTKDLCVNQAFRRDLFVKGATRAWPGQIREILASIVVRSNPFVKPPVQGEPFVFSSGAIEVKGLHDAYSRLLQAVTVRGTQGAPIGEVANAVGTKLGEAGQMVAMLLHGGWLQLVNPVSDLAKEPVFSLNRAIAERFRKGAPYRFVANGSCETALGLSEIEMLILHMQWGVKNYIPQPAEIIDALATLGKQVIKDGQPVTDRDQQISLIQAQLGSMGSAITFWKELGVCPS